MDNRNWEKKIGQFGDTLYVPVLRMCIISVDHLGEEGFDIRFKSGVAIIRNQEGQVVYEAIKIFGMYIVH